MRALAMLWMLAAGCVGDLTAQTASDVSVAKLTGTWVAQVPVLDQWLAITAHSDGTWHMAGADLMDGNVVTRTTEWDGFAYVRGPDTAGGIRVQGTHVAPSTLHSPWQEAWVAGTHIASLLDDGSLSLEPLPGPDGTRAAANVILVPLCNGPCN